VSGVDAERALVARSSLRSLKRTFVALPEGQRRAIALVCVEGYTHREAAAILGVPVGTVISRLARGRRALTGEQPMRRRRVLSQPAGAAG